MNSFEVFADLEKSVHAALETYSNVHRGSGQFSMVSTNLYEKARDIVLDYSRRPCFSSEIPVNHAKFFPG